MGSKDQPQPTVEKLLQAHAVHKISVQYPVINIVATVQGQNVSKRVLDTDLFPLIQSGPRRQWFKLDPSLLLVHDSMEMGSWDPKLFEVVPQAHVDAQSCSPSVGMADAAD
jgi:hypothetical protein